MILNIFTIVKAPVSTVVVRRFFAKKSLTFLPTQPAVPQQQHPPSPQQHVTQVGPLRQSAPILRMRRPALGPIARASRSAMSHLPKLRARLVALRTRRVLLPELQSHAPPSPRLCCNLPLRACRNRPRRSTTLPPHSLARSRLSTTLRETYVGETVTVDLHRIQLTPARLALSPPVRKKTIVSILL